MMNSVVMEKCVSMKDISTQKHVNASALLVDGQSTASQGSPDRDSRQLMIVSQLVSPSKARIIEFGKYSSFEFSFNFDFISINISFLSVQSSLHNFDSEVTLILQNFWSLFCSFLIFRFSSSSSMSGSAFKSIHRIIKTIF